MATPTVSQNMKPLIEILPTVNASLNALATLLLVYGYGQIRRGNERRHKQAMLTAFAVSVLFLLCYLSYHQLRYLEFGSGHVAFAGPDWVRPVYYAILATHLVLAAAVPFLAFWTIYLGLKDRRVRHRQVARWTFPIWLYVSVTGVVIYWMLYHLYPSG